MADSSDKFSGYMRLPAVLEVFPVSKSSWWAGVKAGKYPKPAKLGPRTSAWSKADIGKLLNEIATKEA